MSEPFLMARILRKIFPPYGDMVVVNIAFGSWHFMVSRPAVGWHGKGFSAGSISLHFNKYWREEFWFYHPLFRVYRIFWYSPKRKARSKRVSSIPRKEGGSLLND